MRGPGRPPALADRSFEIAGFRFAVAPGRAAVPLEPSYRDFRARRHRGAGCVRVPLAVDVRPRLRAPANPFYRTETWSICRRGGALLVTLAPQALAGRALVRARLLPDAPRVEAAVCREGLPPLAYPIDQVVLMHLLAQWGGAILHAAGFGFAGRGFAFPGCSGAGKTTLAGLLRAERGWTPLSDDRVVVRRIGGRQLLFGSPWPGQGAVAANHAFPLAALVFLRHGRGAAATPLAPGACLKRLLPVTSIPWYDAAAVPALLGICGAIAEAVPAWELSFDTAGPVGDLLSRLGGEGPDQRPRRAMRRTGFAR